MKKTKENRKKLEYRRKEKLLLGFLNKMKFGQAEVCESDEVFRIDMLEVDVIEDEEQNNFIEWGEFKKVLSFIHFLWPDQVEWVEFRLIHFVRSRQRGRKPKNINTLLRSTSARIYSIDVLLHLKNGDIVRGTVGTECERGIFQYIL